MAPKVAQKGGPPPQEALLVVYSILGLAFSFGLGNEPGGSLDLVDACPSIAVICLFLVSYSVYDVMACGVTKAQHQDPGKQYDDWPTKLPEAAYLAERAQANQVEQIPSFLVSTICFSILVNGMVGACLALVWGILRQLYASKYRNSVGIPLKDKGLAMYTVPCYFIINAMLMGSSIHAIRWAVAAKS